MTYRVSTSDPPVTIDESMAEADLAAFIKAQAIVDQTGWDAFIAAMTATQMLAFAKAFFKRAVKVG